MRQVSTECRAIYNDSIFSNAETSYGIIVRPDVKSFFLANNGGYPTKDIILSDGTEYEVRAFLSLDKNDENYCIEKPMAFFLKNTKARIIPIALDSGDNYYCVNNENGKVYYWRAVNNSYYLIADSIDEYAELFTD